LVTKMHSPLYDKYRYNTLIVKTDYVFQVVCIIISNMPQKLRCEFKLQRQEHMQRNVSDFEGAPAQSLHRTFL